MEKETQENTNPTHEDAEELTDWKKEARGIINDVKSHVAEIEIADGLQSNESCIYLNLKTMEAQTFCVQVSSVGFRIVSNTYNTIDPDKATLPMNDRSVQENCNQDCDQKQSEETEVFETPYALLDKISKSYVNSFGNSLVAQLLHLQQMQEEFNEADEEAEEEEEEEG